MAISKNGSLRTTTYTDLSIHDDYSWTEVHIERIDPVPREFHLTPGQRRTKEAIQEALKKASQSDLAAAAAANQVYRY